jgi:hypothetical protein
LFVISSSYLPEAAMVEGDESGNKLCACVARHNVDAYVTIEVVRQRTEAYEQRRLDKQKWEKKKKKKKEEEEEEGLHCRYESEQKRWVALEEGRVENRKMQQHEHHIRPHKQQGQLSYEDIPWPTIAPADANHSAARGTKTRPTLMEVLLGLRLKDGNLREAGRRSLPDQTALVLARVKIARLRWHPDKLDQVFGQRFSPSDRTRVLARANMILQQLNEFKRRLDERRARTASG